MTQLNKQEKSRLSYLEMLHPHNVSLPGVLHHKTHDRREEIVFPQQGKTLDSHVFGL